MQITIPLAGVLVLVGALPAQQDPPASQDVAEARLEALQAEVQATTAAWREGMRRRAAEAREAAAKGGSVPAMRMGSRPDFSALIPKFEAAADDYAGTDDAVLFLEWITRNGGGRTSEAVQTAFTTLTEYHAGSPAIGKLVANFEYLPRMVGPEAAASFADAVRAQNQDPNVLGWLALGDLGPKIDSADRDSEEYAAAKKSLLSHAQQATDEKLGQQIQAKIDLREKFGVGATAPDIEGIDLDGEAFKLSDYEGKVLFIDFWGDW